MNRSMEKCAGIDVSKQCLDVDTGERQWRVDNSEQGWAALAAALHEAQIGLVVLEATGGYERGCVSALALAGLLADFVDMSFIDVAVF